MSESMMYLGTTIPAAKVGSKSFYYATKRVLDFDILAEQRFISLLIT